jgi:Mlc titration factor MtfA (ptsG expression regulator)
MIALDVVPIVIILLTFSLDLMQQRRNWLKPLHTVLWFPPPIKLIATITEILLKV